MNYILMGLLFAIGWYLVRAIYDVATELLFSRLHNTKWYQIAAGKRPKKTKSYPGDAKAVKNQIGFVYIEKTEL